MFGISFVTLPVDPGASVGAVQIEAWPVRKENMYPNLMSPKQVLGNKTQSRSKVLPSERNLPSNSPLWEVSIFCKETTNGNRI